MNAYITIWLNPKITFENLANKERQSLIALPIILFGLMFGLDIYPDISLVFEEKNILVLILALILGIGFSFLTLGLIIPSLIKLFGKIWKGSSTLRQMVNVCSLSFLPLSFVLVYQIFISFLGIEPKLENLNYGIIYLLWIWSFGLLVIGVAKIQRFKYGKALLNILISYLPFLILGLLRS